MSLQSARSHDLLSTIIRRKTVTLDDVLILRRQIWPDGDVSRGEAEMLFRIDAALEETCGEWTDLFVETVTSYLVDQAHPVGYVADAEAAWLEQRIMQDGMVSGASGLELLVRVLERATHVPHRLETLALETIKTAVLTGDWKLVANRGLEKGVLGDPEVALLRRVLYATAGSASVAIGRDEAAFLCELNDQTADVVHCGAWTVLFVNGIANHLLVNSGYKPPSRDRLKAVDAWLNRPSTGIGGFLLETLQSTKRIRFDTVTAAFADISKDDPLLDRTYPKLGDETIDASEARWLKDRILRDGEITPNEKALLVFLKSGGFDLPPDLHPILDRA